MRNCEKIPSDNTTYRWIYTDTLTELRDMLNDYDLEKRDRDICFRRQCRLCDRRDRNGGLCFALDVRVPLICSQITKAGFSRFFSDSEN